MQVNKEEFQQALNITKKFQRQIMDTIAYCEKNMTAEDKIEIARNSSLYRMDSMITPIIELRREELRSRV
jgi:hypothetical protein